MAQDMSIPWPTNIPQLKRLDELLRCGICYDFMSTSMVTACSHNYCSLCIRQYLDYKTQCPACFSETTSQQLRNNRLLDEIIVLFPSLRDKIAKFWHTSKGNNITSYLANKEVENQDAIDGNTSPPNATAQHQEEVVPSPRRTVSVKDFMSPRKTVVDTPKRNLGKALASSSSNTPVRGSQLEPSSSSSNSSYSVKASAKSPASIFGSQSSPQSSLSQSSFLSQSSRPTASGHFSIRSDGPTMNGGQEENKVNCPVCCVEVPERNINLHLDACLKRMEKGVAEEVVVVQKPKRKALPKLVYSLLSEKQLRQKLKELGLSIQGDKPVLVTRHRRYTTLHNAECDAVNPRQPSELIRQIEREEREETKVATSRSIFTYDRKTAPDIIEKEQASYVKKNHNEFAKLIADVKKRRAEAKKAKEMKTEQSEEVAKKPVIEASGSTFSVEKQENIENTEKDGNEKIEDVRDHEPCKSKRMSFSLFNNNTLKGSDDLRSKTPNSNNEDHARDCHVNECTDSVSTKPVVNDNDQILGVTQSSPRADASTRKVDKKTELPPIVESKKEENSQENAVQPSPDFFSGSPTGSQSSCESFSLLQDCEPIPDKSLEFVGFNAEEDEDIIPGRQPESCSEDEKEHEKTPSPPVGKRSSRNCGAITKPQVPDFSALGPETQMLFEDSQGDPDYLPSQLLEDMDNEDSDFQPLPSQTRRSTRKRKVVQEVPARTTRKKKR